MIKPFLKKSSSIFLKNFRSEGVCCYAPDSCRSWQPPLLPGLLQRAQMFAVPCKKHWEWCGRRVTLEHVTTFNHCSQEWCTCLLRCTIPILCALSACFWARGSEKTISVKNCFFSWLLFLQVWREVHVKILGLSILNCFEIAIFWIFLVLRDSRFNFNWGFISFIRACLHTSVWVWVRFCMWAHRCVRACVHMRRGLSDLGPSIICFSHTTLLQPILSQIWAETSELLGRISSSGLDPQPWQYAKLIVNFSHESDFTFLRTPF